MNIGENCVAIGGGALAGGAVGFFSNLYLSKTCPQAAILLTVNVIAGTVLAAIGAFLGQGALIGAIGLGVPLALIALRVTNNSGAYLLGGAVGTTVGAVAGGLFDLFALPYVSNPVKIISLLKPLLLLIFA